MMKQIKTVHFPDIGEGVVEGEVVLWLKKVGDFVKKDEPIVTVMTDKATVELPSLYEGILVKTYYKEGDIAYLDKPLYDIEVEEEQVEVEKKASQKEEEKAYLGKQEKVIPFPKKHVEIARTSKTLSQNETVKAIPAVRKLAKDLGVDIEQVKGSGPLGRVTKEDVIAFQQKEKQALSTAVHYEGDLEIPIRGVRFFMAKKMAESKKSAAHFSFFDQCEVTRLIQLKENLSNEAKKEEIHITYMPLMIKALSQTIKKHPEINSFYDPFKKSLVVHKKQHVGIAFASKEGLIVPVLKDVQDKSLEEIVYAFDQLKEKVKQGKLTKDDLTGSTITITNFGPLGGRWATPIINYPEVAILGISKIVKEPVVKKDKIVIAPILRFSWSFDHRVIDGALAAAASNYLIYLLQNPLYFL